MSEEPKGTPVTQEWIGTLLVGYFIVGPLILLAIMGLAVLIKWIIP